MAAVNLHLNSQVPFDAGDRVDDKSRHIVTRPQGRRGGRCRMAAAAFAVARVPAGLPAIGPGTLRAPAVRGPSGRTGLSVRPALRRPARAVCPGETVLNGLADPVRREPGRGGRDQGDAEPVHRDIESRGVHVW